MTYGTIAITRPPTEPDELSEALQERGFHALRKPMTHIVLRHTAASALDKALRDAPDAVLVTSRHGAQALATLTATRDMPLVCVGETTYNTALSAGFSRVAMAGGNVDRLMEYVLSAYDTGSRVLYASAEHVRMDVAAALERQGMRAERVVLYEAAAAERFSDTFAEHLRRGDVDAVTFLSQRAAEIFMKLAREAGLTDALREMRAYTLSEAITEELDKTAWRSLHTSMQMTLASLVSCIDETWEERKTS